MRPDHMAMAEMGYVVIGAAGPDPGAEDRPRDGEHAEDIIKAVRQSAASAA